MKGLDKNGIAQRIAQEVKMATMSILELVFQHLSPTLLGKILK